MPKPRLIGINHVALEVTDLEAALEFYGSVFDFEIRGRAPGMAFLDMADQFLAIAEVSEPHRDGERHFGLVVDDLEATRELLRQAGAELLSSRGLDFRDPWGNHVQIVDYREIQFAKTVPALATLGAAELEKRDSAIEEMREKDLLETDGEE